MAKPNSIIADRMKASVELVSLIASLDKDEEEVDGVEFDMTNDDAYDTLHSLISAARAIEIAEEWENAL